MEKVIYTTCTIAEDLDVSIGTVYSWIYAGKLVATKPTGKKAYEVFDNDYADFLRRNTRYLIRHKARVAAKNHEAEEQREAYNHEGYLDPTAYFAIRKTESVERYRKMIKEMFKVVNDNGFKVEGRITFVDKKTGKVYR